MARGLADRTTIRFTARELAALRRHAKARDLSAAQVVRAAVRRYLEIGPPPMSKAQERVVRDGELPE